MLKIRKQTIVEVENYVEVVEIDEETAMNLTKRFRNIKKGVEYLGDIELGIHLETLGESFKGINDNGKIRYFIVKDKFLKGKGRLINYLWGSVGYRDLCLLLEDMYIIIEEAQND